MNKKGGSCSKRDVVTFRVKFRQKKKTQKRRIFLGRFSRSCDYYFSIFPGVFTAEFLP